MERFSEIERRGPSRRKRGKRWENLHERGPTGFVGTPGLGITSAPITKKLYDASDDVKNYLKSKRSSY